VQVEGRFRGKTEATWLSIAAELRLLAAQQPTLFLHLQAVTAARDAERFAAWAGERERALRRPEPQEVRVPMEDLYNRIRQRRARQGRQEFGAWRR